jgi:hypothetical protein
MWISEAGTSTIHRWFSGAYLMRSSGHILLSLLPISGWLNRSLISWLLFCAVRFLWFFAYVLMTSVTYGMRKSLCKVTFDMYQGALASFLNVLDWNVWRIFVLSYVNKKPALTFRQQHLQWLVNFPNIVLQFPVANRLLISVTDTNLLSCNKSV